LERFSKHFVYEKQCFVHAVATAFGEAAQFRPQRYEFHDATTHRF
jgi:hypothetical protein